MLIAIEKDIAMKIKSNKDKIIDKIAESSAEMSSLQCCYCNLWTTEMSRLFIC